MRCILRLGDAVEKALSSIGITESAIKEWLGNCGCQERKRRLNELSDWVARFFGVTIPDHPPTKVITTSCQSGGLCRHRGTAVIDMIPLESLKKNLTVKVFSCDVFGKCTMARGVSEHHSCSGCDKCESRPKPE